MSIEGNHNSKPGNEPAESIENSMDSLLPIPNADATVPADIDEVDGTIDEVLPIPGDTYEAADDTSTREELEVDTTADGIDDRVPVQPATDAQASENPGISDEPTVPSECMICGATVAGTRYCQDCGTEQVPASAAYAKIAPFFAWSRPLAIRAALSFGAVLALLALLADSGTTALIIAAATLPMVLLIHLADKLGGLNRIGWIQIGMMILVGLASGLPISWISARMVSESWFEVGVLNFGAANFGGIAVEASGNAPFLVWLTSGILFPTIVILIIGAAPAGLRMALSMPPHETTGMILSAGVAAGYLLGSAIVYYQALYSELPPIMSTSEWTLTIIGVSAVRPVIWVYSGAILGAVVWRYLRNASLPDVGVPAAIAVGLPLGYSIVSLAIAPAGLWASILLGIIFAGVTTYLLGEFVLTARTNDASLGH